MSSDPANVSVYQDWDLDNALNSSAITISSAHPEDKNIPYFGDALFDSNEVYRSRRVYGEKVSIDISSQSVHSVKIEAESPLALYNIDIWGPYVAGAGSRTPTNDP